MANIRDIITARGEKDRDMPEYFRTVRDTTGGATQERYTNNVIDILGGIDNLPNWMENVEYAEEPILPSLDKFFTTAGITDDKAKNNGFKDAKDMFLNGYPKYRKVWEGKIKKDNVLGEEGVKTFNSLWKRALFDKAEEDTRKGRADAVNDGTVSGFLARTVFPRSTERIAATGDYEPKDMWLDLAENAAMSVPGAGFVKAGGTVARTLRPSLVLKAAQEAEKLANSGSRIANYIPKAVTAARNVASNAVVPLASEIADDFAYDVGEGMDDRANFDLGDVVVGTAVNQAVQQGLLRDALPLITRYGGVDRQGQRAAKQGLRDWIATLGQSRKKLGQDVVTEARDVVGSPVVRAFPEGTQVTQNELRGLTNGVDIIPEGVSVDDYLNAKRIATVADMVDNGRIKFKPWKDIEKAYESNQESKRNVEDIIRGLKKQAGDTYQEANKASDYIKRNELRVKAEQLNHDADALISIMGDDKITSGALPSDIVTGVGNSVNIKTPMSREVVRDVINKNPELYNYAYWKNAPWYAQLENAVHQAWPSYVVNKSGKSNYASDVVRATKDMTKKNREDSKEQSKKVQVSKIIAASPSLSDTDKVWLSRVAENPGIVKNGYHAGSAKDADDFKMWLLTGGNDLLRGTDVFRPVWEIE